MLHTSAQLFAMSIGCDYQTASKRLRNLPHIKSENGVYLVALARALPILRLKEDVALPAIFHSARSIPALLPIDAESIAQSLETWLHQTTKHLSRQGALTRLSSVQRAFAQHIADATESSILCRHTEQLRRLLILDDQIARYVILSDANAMPSNFRKFSIEFALANTPQKEFS